VTKRTVYVVDDEEPIRSALKLMLGVQGFAVTPFASGPQFLDVASALVPGCVLLDVRMPEMDGVEVQRRLLSHREDLPVVVMTGHGDMSVAANALQNGAVGFVEKPFAKAILRRSLDAAFLKLEDADRYQKVVAAHRAAVDALTEEERAILSRLAAGRSNEAIAAEQQVSIATIEVRRARLFATLGVESVNEALAVAFVGGLRA